MKREDRITYGLYAIIVLISALIALKSSAMEKRGDMVTRIEPVSAVTVTIQRSNATDAADGMVFDIKGDYQAQIVADAPTFYWKLDGDYVDAMGLATTGTASVGVFGVAKYGTASAIMNGTNGYINIPHNSSMNFSTNIDFSVEYWVKLSGSPSIGTNYQVISHTSTGSNGFYTGVINNAGIYGWFFNIGAINYVSTAITIDSNWHYIVFVLNRSNSVTLYVDGISQIISGIPNQNTDVTNQLTIGGRSFTQPLRVVFGSIDEVAIYRRMLTQAEVTKHYLNNARTKLRMLNSNNAALEVIAQGPLSLLTSSGVYASIYTADSTTTTSVPTGTVYTKVTNWDGNGPYSNATPSYIGGKITITEPGTYEVIGSFSISGDVTGVVLYGALFYDGVEFSSCHFERKLATTDVGVMGFACDLPASANKDIDLRFRHDGIGTENVMGHYMNLKIRRQGS